VGPTGQTPSVKPIEPVLSDRTTHSPPTSPTRSRDVHGDCVARAIASVRWSTPAIADLAAAAKVIASFYSTFSPEESSWVLGRVLAHPLWIR
jgi:hypothetical protein